MKQKWSGDGRFYLPARRVEPYRLWFEFLKLALNDPDIEVDRDFYAEWGDVEGQEFSDWWSGETWRKLFAVDAGVRLMDRAETLPDNDPSLIVRLPLGKDIRDTLSDVEALLEEHSAGVRFDRVPRGRFALSEGAEKGFLKQMGKARVMLRLYGYWLAHGDKSKSRRVQEAAKDFYDWAKSWDDKITEKRWRRTRIDPPLCFEYWVQNHLRGVPIEVPTNATPERKDKIHKRADPENARRQVTRYIAKARKMAGNVGRGEFPGKYD
jgi:hypothetical protein